VRHVRAMTLALTAAAAIAACGGDSPTSPSNLKDTVKVGDVSFSVIRASLFRDFMPIAVNPGPDGGRRLAGVVIVRAGNEGRPAAFTLGASVYEANGTRHAVTVVAHDYDQETLLPGRDIVWAGTIGEGKVQWLELRLDAGPYLPVGSHAYVVLDWKEQGGRTGSMRTAEVEIAGTY